MSKSNALETALLSLIFNGDAIANLADDAGTAPLTSLYVALHTADPGEAGDQTSNECAYTSYARVAIARTSSGWTVSGNSVVPVASPIVFPTATGGSETATHISVGTAASGAGVLYYSGALSTSITISNGTPVVATLTITED